MPRIWGALSLAVCLLTAAADAAAGPPDAAKVRVAADEFDAGSLAYKARDYETAASHFEAADEAVPSPKALRWAIRARSEAGQGSRAATLAARAQARYPNDADTAKLAKDTLEKVGSLVHKVSVSCASPCVLAVGTRGIPGEATTRWIVYLDPGEATVSASFFGGAGGAQQAVKATAGGSSELRFEPAEKESPGAVAPTPAPAPSPATTSAAETPPSDVVPDVAPKPRSGISPAFFVAGLVVTAGLGGVTIWSGIDTKNNPGADVVRDRCAGKTAACPEYAAGRAHQMRTNVLIGATAGAAALTGVVGIFLTDWGGHAAPAPAGASRERPRVSAVPVVLERGAGLGARGQF